MKYLNQGLLFILIGFFFIFSSSCKSPGSLGLEIDPSNLIVSLGVDTFTIKAATVREDSIVTTGLSQQPFGLLLDPELGETSSGIAFTLNTPPSGATFGKDATLDSAVLALKYGSEFYGDSINSTYKINLYQLSNINGASYIAGKSYYNTKAWNFSSDPVGTITLNKFAIHENVNIRQVTNGKSALINSFPQIRIRLADTFVNNNFLNPAVYPYHFKNSARLQNFLRGFYLSIDKTQTTGMGGIVFFDMSPTSDDSRLEVYYKIPTEANIQHVAYFTINGLASSRIIHNYSQAVKSQLNNPQRSYEVVYAQPMMGLRTQVSFPYLKALSKLGNFAINRAILIVKINTPQTSPSLAPAPRLTFYTSDIAGQRQPVPDNNIGQIGYPDFRALPEKSFGGFYDAKNKQYIFNITSYVQDILSGKRIQYNAYIAPMVGDSARSAHNGLYPSAATAGRSILSGAKGNYPMKLQIIYTRLN